MCSRRSSWSTSDARTKMFLLSLRGDSTHAEHVFDLNSSATLERLPGNYRAKQLSALLVRSLQRGDLLSETRVRAPLEPADVFLSARVADVGRENGAQTRPASVLQSPDNLRKISHAVTGGESQRNPADSDMRHSSTGRRKKHRTCRQSRRAPLPPAPVPDS